MEKQSHTRPPKTSKQLAVAVEGKLNFFRYILDSGYCRLTTTKSEARLMLQENSGQLNVLTINEDRIFSFNHTDKPDMVLDFLQSYIDFFHKTSKPSSIKSSLKKCLPSSGYDKIVKYVHTFIKKPITLNLLPEKILNFKWFSNHQSCQILSHEKGNPLANNYSFDYNNGLKNTTLPAGDFNKLFQSFKKSKKRFFNSTQIKSQHLSAIGFFLKQIYELKQHNVILIISRNDFLAPEDSEVKSFNICTNLFRSFIENLLIIDSSHKKLALTYQAVDLIPVHLKISSDNDRLLYKNMIASKDSSFVEDEKAEHLINQIQLDNNYKVSYRNPEGFSALGDFYHFQRISLLGELLNTLRHELSNPLFGITLANETYDKNLLDEEQLDTFQQIIKEAVRCQNIIENFSSIYTNKESATSQILLKKIVQESLALAKSEVKFINKEIIYESPIDKETFEIRTNGTWLTQILFNLLINSSHAIKNNNTINQSDKKIKIHIVHGVQDNQLNILISDNGNGITPENINKIFNPFFTTKSQGTGLGLSICKHLANKLGGDIQFIDSSPPFVTTFKISLQTG